MPLDRGSLPPLNESASKEPKTSVMNDLRHFVIALLADLVVLVLALLLGRR